MANDLAIVMQLTVGGVLGTAAIAKLRDMQGFTRGILALNIVRPDRSRTVAWLIVSSEALVGMTHFSGIYLKAGATVGVILLSVFVVAIIAIVRNGTTAACHCFGPSDSDHISMRTFLRVALLLVGECIVLSGRCGQLLSGQESCIGWTEGWWVEISGAIILWTACASLLSVPDIVPLLTQRVNEHQH